MSETALVIKKPQFLQNLEKSTNQINDIMSQLNQLASITSDFEKGLMYAHFISEMKASIEGKTFEIIKNLMNTGLGFKTDRNPNAAINPKSPYPDEIVKDCVVQAMIHGLRIYGNEFNIIGGNFYVTKEGLERIVLSHPNLEKKVDLQFKGSKQSPDTGKYAITWEFSFKFKGSQEVSGTNIVFVNGKVGKNDYDVSFDSVLGKARRKILNYIYNEMTNGFKIQDADDIDDIIIEAEVTEDKKSKISQILD